VSAAFYERVSTQLDSIRRDGLYKAERVMTSPQAGSVTIAPADARVINLCANNYLGLANDPRVIEASVRATREGGAGLASVRFICGTHDIHKHLERAIAEYLGFEDAILFAAAFDANGGIFEALLTERDAVVSATLNHASIIDGIRLCKARRYRFDAERMDELEAVLAEARDSGAETILIVTDGVFSMDGHIADLAGIVRLAEEYRAIVMVDDCHATGLVGPGGRGSLAYHGVDDRVDIVSGTFGKALGGAMGGFICARARVVELLRQRCRPYLFSNALAPGVCGAALAAIEIARSDEGETRRRQMTANTLRFRNKLSAAGFALGDGEHPIVPIMLGDAALAQKMAAALLDRGVLATGFSFPVVARGAARIRAQLSAAHSHNDIDCAVDAFVGAGRALGVIATTDHGR
jgi:glycine C-acetyltransferase